MPEAATAVLALWNGVDPALEAEYEDWHAREHVPERLTVPGMLWGLRYRLIDAATPADCPPDYLTLYGLHSPAVLDSAAYQRLLRAPTPASRRMRPALTRLTRWVCTLLSPGRLEAGDGLAVWTLPAANAQAATVPPLPAPEPADLLARRLPDASPLPWLRAGQDQPIQGDWLVCRPLANAAVSGPPAGAWRYSRLPVGQVPAPHTMA